MIVFKKAGKEDLTVIQKIARETWPETFKGIIPDAQIAYMLDLIYSRDALERQIGEKNHIFLLAFQKNIPLGFTSYEINYDGQPVLMVQKIYLLPASQGLGIGTEFLNLLSEAALKNNNNRLRLKVYFKNSKAIGFYKKYGFKKVSAEKTDLGNNYSVLDDVMEKQLIDS